MQKRDNSQKMIGQLVLWVILSWLIIAAVSHSFCNRTILSPQTPSLARVLMTKMTNFVIKSLDLY